jgi:hypothetical protein
MTAHHLVEIGLLIAVLLFGYYWGRARGVMRAIHPKLRKV